MSRIAKRNTCLVAASDVTKSPLYLGFNEYGSRWGYKGGAHALTLGPTGSGKSTSLVVPNLVIRRGSCIVLDPKGQLAAITARHRATLGKVIVLNPFGVLLDRCPYLEEYTQGWNPLAQLDPQGPDFASDAQAAAEAVVTKGTGNNSEFFDASMENLWSVFCMWERLTKGKDASLRNVREQLAESDLVETLKLMAQNSEYAIRVAGKRALARLTDKNSQSTSTQDVIETVMKNTVFLNDHRIAADMDGGEAIDFTRMHEEITTVYVILPVGQLIRQAKWLRLFVNLAIANFLRSPPEVAKLPPVLFMLDEFGNIGRLPEVLNVLTIARDLRLQLWVFIQYLEQLKTSYEKEWTAFFSSAGATTTFGARDWETAEMLSKITGKTETEITNNSMNYGAAGIRSLSFGHQSHLHVHQLIEPEDFMKLERGATINFIDPCPDPARGLAPGYWQIGDMAKRLDPNPYYLG